MSAGVITIEWWRLVLCGVCLLVTAYVAGLATRDTQAARKERRVERARERARERGELPW